MNAVLSAIRSYLNTLTGLTTTVFTLYTFPDMKFVGVRISYEGDEPTYVLDRSTGDQLPRLVLVFTSRATSLVAAEAVLTIIKTQLESKTVVTQGTVTFNAFTAQGNILQVGLDEGLYVATLRVGVQYAT